MYYPYFRGKQFELLAVRESAPLIAAHDLRPVIEPVNENLRGLERALEDLIQAGAQAVVIVNPRHGYFSQENEEILQFVLDRAKRTNLITPGILLTSDTRLDRILSVIRECDPYSPILVHAGFSDGKGLRVALSGSSYLHIFVGDHRRLHRTALQEISNGDVIIRDGFEVRKNADYGDIDHFSDLHATFKMEGAVGFGDFLTVGDRYSEGGGPAYAVAIHITVLDPGRDNDMFVLHFVSDTNHTPVDPASKFAEAVAKLKVEASREGSLIQRTNAIREFLDLEQRGHYPGLGFIKKLSMKHHLELMAGYIGSRS